MIKLLFTFLIILFGSQFVNSQITFRGCTTVLGAQDFTLVATGTTNDAGTIRNTFESSPADFAQSCPAGVCEIQIKWNTGTSRWEVQLDNDGPVGAADYSTACLYFNTAASFPNPPDLTLGSWQDCSGGNCPVSQFVTMSGDVQSSISACTDPTVPAALVATPSTVCAGSTSTITWSGALNDATQWHIYTGSCGGTQVGTSVTNSFTTAALSGTTTFFIRGEDGAGCVDETTGLCGTVMVTVGDVTNPTISCPVDQNQSVNAACQFILADYTGLATAADNCSGVTVTQAPLAGTTITGGTVVTLTATDGASNTSNCNFNVVGLDVTAPTAVCQNINVYLDGAGNASIVAADIDGGSTDNCGPVTLSATPLVFSCADLAPVVANDLIITAAYDGPLSGGTPKGIELYVANDIADLSQYGIGSANNGGGTDGEEFTFPAVSVSAGQYIYVASEAVQFNNWFGFAPDYTSSAMGINGDDAIELFYIGGVIDVLGDINVDGTGQPWDYLDGWAYRNTGTGPDGSTFQLGSWSFSGTNVLDAETSNATAATPIIIGTYSLGSVASAPVSVTLTVTDGLGNFDNCVATVTVIDTISLTITCPGNQLESPDAACNFTLPDYTGLATPADNCTTSPTVTQSPAAGTVISGTTTITMTATDAAGLTSTCTFDVTLNDVTAPTAVCQNINVYLDGAGNASLVAADLDGGSTDNCSGITLVASVTAFTCANVGANNVTLTATDGNTNSDNCIAVVTVLDTISPVVTCPGDQAEIASVSCDFVLPDYTSLASATDNCGGTLPITQSPAIGTLINANTLITMTSDDGNGNTSTCTFNVNLDFSACVGAECSNAIAVALAPCGDTQTETGSTVGGTTSTETSFCGTSAGLGGANWYTFTGDGGDWTASSVNAGTNYDTKIWVYDGVCGSLNCVTGNDDFGGAQSQATFPTVVGTEYYVIIGGWSTSEGNYELTFSNVETIAPVADLATLADVTGVCEITTLTDPTATDNCSAVTVTNDVTLPISTNSTITWTYTDVNGNSSTQTQNVVLTDGVAPTASNPADSSYECVGDAIIDVAVVTDEADNCSGLVTVTHVSDVVTGNGCLDTITRTYNVADGSGNNMDVVQMIYIEDITAPTASNPLDLTVQCIGQVPAPATGWVSDEADNCATPTVAFVSDVSDGLSCPETITRTFSVTDACGNSIDVVQLVIILDIDAPVSDLAALPELTSLCGVTPVTATATDNCDGALDGVSDVTFPITALGTTTVTWTYTDACGNMSTQEQDVTISAIDVSVVMASDNITFVANNFLPGSGVTYQWIDCDLDQPIAGETNHNYIPTYGSNFAVIITEAGCSDTSACMPSTVGIDGLVDIKTLVLYPNPTNGVLNIDYEGEIKSIQVVDMLGREIMLPISVNEKTVDGSNLTTGKYMIRITTESDQILVKEFVVQK